MFFLPGKYVSTGIEISAGNLKAVNVSRTGRHYIVQDSQNVKIPAQAFKCSFKHLNILDPDLFADCIDQLSIKNKKKRLSIALPDGCCRTVIRRYNELPESEDRVTEMIMWDMANQVKVNDISELRCAWEYGRQKSENGEHVFIIAVLLEKVIEQYESLFQRQDWKIDRILPAGVARYNFYAPDFSKEERLAFLGLFDESISIFIFEQGIPRLYKILRKGLLGDSNASAMNDLDLLLQYCHSELPEKKADRIVIASDKAVSEDVRHFLATSFSADDCQIADENSLMDFSRIKGLNKEINSFSQFSAALGAAKRGG
ncbi:MAG: hypothetical protein HUN04_13995 [Desulfobacter sp.]|nr:MAG: hypothetical protein HUN04_13995 [Desulfobacter sp.]